MANINIRVSDETKALIHSNAKAAGLTATSWIELKCAGEPPKRKAPTKERATLIQALSNLGHIRRLLEAQPEDTSAAQAQITFIANKIHDEFDYDS
ncbi:plasmid mobilization protein [Dyadobacter sp. CY327]|uniref:plasmid mobilization protein n=1 Tax=Dyadobacter sp. CY327 TaxID=2907301 RepID=UPI0038D51062